MDGWVTLGTKLDTKSFEKQIDAIEGRLEEIDEMLSKPKKYDLTESDIAKLNVEAEKLNNNLLALKKKQNDINMAGFTNFNKSLTTTIKKVGKWAMAVFGVRSAYMAIRSAINVITADDAQLKADIDYMKNAIAYALEPVARKIVDLAKQLLLIIQGIIYAITGKNIFENANKSLKKANGQAKELKKTLAGFDEMNILQDTSTGGGGSSEMPSFNLNDISTAEEAIEKLKSKWNELGETMHKNLYDTDFSVWTNAFGEWDLAVFGVIQQIYGLWRVISGLGEAVKGIIEIITGIIEGDTEKIKEGFKDFIKGIWEAILGVVEFIKGFENTVRGIIKGLLQTLLGWLFEFINKGIGIFNNFIEKINGKIGNLRDKIKKTVEDIQSWLTKKFGVVGTVIGEVIGGAFKGVVNAVLRVIENILNTPIRAINGLISAVGKIPGVNINKLQTFSFPRLAKGGIINMPGRGVPVGSAIGGERGQEGVIPLTDSQQMALLGEAIGKYININATVPVYVGNRMLVREIKRIKAEDDFAYNR